MASVGAGFFFVSSANANGAVVLAFGSVVVRLGCGFLFDSEMSVAPGVSEGVPVAEAALVVGAVGGGWLVAEAFEEAAASAGCGGGGVLGLGPWIIIGAA